MGVDIDKITKPFLATMGEVVSLLVITNKKLDTVIQELQRLNSR